jgi:type IV secretion system protein VirB1
MAYSAAVIFALASQCAPNVAPQTVIAVVQTESHGYPFALNVNGGAQPRAQSNAAAAAATAQRYIAAGFSVDLGLGQINSRNMRSLGLTWETVFDPCTNIAALGRILTLNYSAAIDTRDPQTALRIRDATARQHRSRITPERRRRSRSAKPKHPPSPTT